MKPEWGQTNKTARATPTREPGIFSKKLSVNIDQIQPNYSPGDGKALDLDSGDGGTAL